MKYQSYYQFPHLEYIDEHKKGTIYTLNWKQFDQKVRERETKWKEQSWPETDFNIDNILKLPQEYEDLLNNSQYLIRTSYLASIMHYINLSQFERNQYNPFDTCIREYCLKVPEAAVNVAFKLIADCLYDPKTEYFCRDWDIKSFHSTLLLYKFWLFQTGRGLVCERDFADIERLNEEYFLTHDPERAKAIQKFKSMVEKQQEKICAEYDKIAIHDEEECKSLE